MRNAYHLCTNQKRPYPTKKKKKTHKHKHIDKHTSIICFPNSVSALHADWRQIEIKRDVRTLATPNRSNAALNVTHTHTNQQTNRNLSSIHNRVTYVKQVWTPVCFVVEILDCRLKYFVVCASSHRVVNCLSPPTAPSLRLIEK